MLSLSESSMSRRVMIMWRASSLVPPISQRRDTLSPYSPAEVLKAVILDRALVYAGSVLVENCLSMAFTVTR